MGATHQALLALGGAAAVGDPYFANVVSLCHFNGTNGSTTVVDQIGSQSWSANNGATLSTAQQLFGTASGFIGADGNDTFTGATTTNFTMGTGDFTIEFQYYPTAIATKNIFDMRTNGNATDLMHTLYTLSTGELIYYVNGADRITSAAGVITANTWHAIAVARVSGTTRLFVGGTQRGSNYTDSTNYGSIRTPGITLPSWTAPAVSVYYDELRVTKGVGRHTGTYTPDTAAFPDF